MTGTETGPGRTLVAGVGNVFQRDDAFGVEVIRLLAGRPRPAGWRPATHQAFCPFLIL